MIEEIESHEVRPNKSFLFHFIFSGSKQCGSRQSKSRQSKSRLSRNRLSRYTSIQKRPIRNNERRPLDLVHLCPASRYLPLFRCGSGCSKQILQIAINGKEVNRTEINRKKIIKTGNDHENRLFLEEPNPSAQILHSSQVDRGAKGRCPSIAGKTKKGNGNDAETTGRTQGGTHGQPRRSPLSDTKNIAQQVQSGNPESGRKNRQPIAVKIRIVFREEINPKIFQKELTAEDSASTDPAPVVDS
ncbi:MAG: hypothetical protein VX768_18600 [Planctomycetota bacterium]|nr:hypothetical protein [Planctomycetota bacterium]